MSFLDTEPYERLLQEYYEHYYGQLIAQIPEISNTTYCIIVASICIPPLLLLWLYELEQAKLRFEEPKGCRKLGLNIESNLMNEFDRKFSEGRPPSTEETSAEWWRIKSLWIYPIKSCRGVELNRSTILATGMEFDRQFTFAQLKSPFPVGIDADDKEKAAHKWEFLTQRQCPMLAMVRTEMWGPDQSVHSYSPHCEDVESGGVIVVSFPYSLPGWRGKLAEWGAYIRGTIPEKTFRVPFNPTDSQIERAGYKYEPMTIWKDTVSALNLEVEIPDELRYFLGLSNKLGLFRVDNQALREVYRCAPKKEELGFQPVTGFQDAVSFPRIENQDFVLNISQYPLHLINLASVRDVERQIPKVKGMPRLSAQRFRANIISECLQSFLGSRS